MNIEDERLMIQVLFTDPSQPTFPARLFYALDALMTSSSSSVSDKGTPFPVVERDALKMFRMGLSTRVIGERRLARECAYLQPLA